MHANELKLDAWHIPPELNDITGSIIDSAICIHSQLGPGLLESIYETCLTYELQSRGYTVESQVNCPIEYRGVRIESGLKLDLLINDSVIIEIKTVDKLLPVHEAQILSYMKLTGKRIGLLINFKSHLVKEGIKRFVL